MANTNTKRRPTPLRVALAKAGMTQAELAARAGITLGTVSLVARTGYATKATAERLAAALGVEVDQVAGELS